MPTINVESTYNVLLSKILLVLYIWSVLMCFWFFCCRKLYFHSILYHRLLFAKIYFLSSSEIATTLNSYTGHQFSLGTFPSPPCTHYYYSMYLHPVTILRICSALVLWNPYLFFHCSQCLIFRFHRKVSGIQVCQITLSLIYICNIFSVVVSHLYSQLI